jgi:putative heme-binding domain-containing protein
MHISFFPRIAVAAIVATSFSLGSSSRIPAQISEQPKINVPEGFRVECLYRVPAQTQGSWVALADAGRRGLIASDQYGKLYEISWPDVSSVPAVLVKPLDIGVGSAQGLLVAFDSLYVMVNDGEKSGLYRSVDADGDGQWDPARRLLPIDGSGEHGPHAVVVSPDRQALLICAGNHTKLPHLTSSRVPPVWAEDLLLPRLWDPGGHAVGLMAPGGWICRVTPDGSECKLVSIGYRNSYDLALNADGELFTYDADMEWDEGTAWYRPTRILHVTSGSDFGWRGGTGKWPAYYADSLPSVIDLGPGSPTGMTFGFGTKFPKRYQHALFAADWSYGRIHAVHLHEEGASYVGESEVFASAAALPVTDLVVRPSDGMLYFVTGGRRLQSALFRITYQGSESIVADTSDVTEGDQQRQSTPSLELRTLRHDIEQLHDTSDADGEIDVIGEAFPFLNHPDRHIRYAARTALELQPAVHWLHKTAGHRDVDGRIELAIAGARHGKSADARSVPKAIEQLGTIDFEAISLAQKLRLLRAYALASVRLGDDQINSTMIHRFSPRFPSGQRILDRELCRVLAHVNAPGIVEKMMDALEMQQTNEDRTHYLFALSCVHDGWTRQMRCRYFDHLAAAHRRGGGKSYGGYIDAMASRSVSNMSPDERPEFQARADEMVEDDNNADWANAPFVRDWKLDEVLHLVENRDALASRRRDHGRQAFVKANCFACHQIGDEGGAQGPSLTSIGARFGIHDLVRTIVDPSREISDQYTMYIFELADGKTLVGRIVNLDGGDWRISTDMMNPGLREQIDPAHVESMVRSTVSPMPTGLLNVLNNNEVLDLFAYLASLQGP